MESTSPELLKRRMSAAISATRGKVRAGEHGEGTTFGIGRIDAGKLRLPTGRLCVADAYGDEDYAPLNRIVPPGDYPVELVIAELPKDIPFGNGRCAFLIVTISGEMAVSWEPVTAVAATHACFEDPTPNQFVQEGGTGVFSPEAVAVHFGHLRQQYDAQIDAMEKVSTSFGCGEWCNFTPGPDSPNLVMCSGGFGDGYYHCFVGLTIAGRVARIVIDFNIADPAEG